MSMEQEQAPNNEEQIENEDAQIVGGQSQSSDDTTNWKAEAEKLKAEKAKSEEIALNYKKEAEKLRRQGEDSRLSFDKPKGNADPLYSDFLSKREDVIDEIKNDINQLDDGEWQSIQHLLRPAVQSVYETAKSQNRYVARGEIKRTISNLIEYAKSSKSRQSELEQARADGAREMAKMEDAEISGVRNRPSQDSGNDAARQLAEEKGWDIATAQEILKKRSERAKEYAVPQKY